MIDFSIDTSRLHPPVRARKFAARAFKKQLCDVRCLCAPSEWAACRATGAQCVLRS
jgi:hypothetical protein